MRLKRFRPSPAMIVACAALFVALGGTAVATSYVISSNGQVGPGTISGHHPPSGDHANVITGSLDGQDLAGSSVNSAKVQDNSLTGADINEQSLGLTSFRSSQTARDTTADQNPVNGTPTTIMNVGNLTLTATCQSNYALGNTSGSYTQYQGLKIVASSPTAGGVNWGNQWTEAGHDTHTTLTPSPGMLSPDVGHVGGSPAFSGSVLEYWKGYGLRGVLTLVDDDTAGNRGETVQLGYQTYQDSPSGDAVCREWGTVQRSA